MGYENKVENQKESILNQSAKVMPSSPSALGYTETQIRAFLWKPIESLLNLLSQVEKGLSNYSKELDDATQKDISTIRNNLEDILQLLDGKVGGDEFYEQIESLSSRISEVSNRLPQAEVDRIKSTLQVLENTIEDVESIAKGSNQAISFNNYEELVDYLNVLEPNKLKVGQNIYIATRNVPDVWVQKDWGIQTNNRYTYTSDEAIVELLSKGNLVVGHYQIQPLETQKVDITDYVSKDEVDDELSLESEKPVQNKVIAKEFNERVKFTDYATKEKAGVVKVSGSAGVYMDANGYLYTAFSNKSQIDKKTNSGTYVAPYNLDYAVKKALSDCQLSTKDPTNNWTDDEKQSARDLLGVSGKLDEKISIFPGDSAGYPNYFYGMNTSVGEPKRYPTQANYTSADFTKASRVVMTQNGGVIRGGIPVIEQDLTPKKYVDDEIAKVGIDTFNWNVQIDEGGTYIIACFMMIIPNYAQYKYFTYKYGETENYVIGGETLTGMFGISPVDEGSSINLGVDTFTIAFDGTTAILVGQMNDTTIYDAYSRGVMLGGIYGIK